MAVQKASQADLQPFIEPALACIMNAGHDMFSLDNVASIISDMTTIPMDQIHLEDVKSLLIKQWGKGIEPAAIGAHHWKFGWGMPPVSRERRW